MDKLSGKANYISDLESNLSLRLCSNIFLSACSAAKSRPWLGCRIDKPMAILIFARAKLSRILFKSFSAPTSLFSMLRMTNSSPPSELKSLDYEINSAAETDGLFQVTEIEDLKFLNSKDKSATYNVKVGVIRGRHVTSSCNVKATNDDTIGQIEWTVPTACYDF